MNIDKYIEFSVGHQPKLIDESIQQSTHRCDVQFQKNQKIIVIRHYIIFAVVNWSFSLKDFLSVDSEHKRESIEIN